MLVINLLLANPHIVSTCGQGYIRAMASPYHYEKLGSKSSVIGHSPRHGFQDLKSDSKIFEHLNAKECNITSYTSSDFGL